MSAVTARALGDALAAVVGRGRLADHEAARAAAAVDGRVPRWVVRPAAAEQVAGVLALAHDAGLAVIPRGSGSALGLGAPPAAADLVLDLGDLDRVVDDRPDDLTVSVEAGVTGGALAERLRPRRQHLPLDPPGSARRTLGGMIATNASGPSRARWGTARDLLLGVRFVQADGVLTWGGARVVKSVTGYDVPKLMVGALGTLGVLVELTLRLHPVPDAEGSWLATFTHPDPAQAFVERLLDSEVQPTRVEWVSGAALAACGQAGAALGVAVSVGSVEAAVRAQGERLAQFARQTGGPLTALPPAFWAALDARLAQRDGVGLRVGTPVSRLAATARDLGQALAAAAPGVAAVVAGCATAASLRVLLPPLEPGAAAGLVERLRAALGPAGGHVVVEHGPPELRTALDPWGPVEPEAFALMRALRDEFDGRRTLNPGRFVGGL